MIVMIVRQHRYIHLFRKALLGFAAAAAVATCTAQITTLSTNAIADAFVTTGSNGSLSTSNFGAAGALALSASGLPKGEFQTVLKFQLSGIKSSLDAIYGTGLWTVQSVSLSLTASSHNNSIFNNIAAGNFSISLMQNSSWVEGTGSGGIPTSDGISFSTLQSTYINNVTDQGLGTFSFNGSSSDTANYSLNLSSDLVSDLMDGNTASLRLFAADSDVTYLFTSRTAGGPTVLPTLIITVVPEPDSVALCIAGAAVIAWLRAIKKKGENNKK